MAELSQILNEACQRNFDLPWAGSVYAWADEYIDLPSYFAFQFDSELSPYLIQPFNDLLDPNVEQINLQMARQLGKTLFSDISIPYFVANDPGPIIRLHQDDLPAKQFLETRLAPILKSCEKTKALVSGRYAIRTYEVVMPHTTIFVSGHSENKLNGRSARYLYIDEAHLFEKGSLAKAFAMTNAFAGRRKIIITSTPGVAKDQFSEQVNRGFIYQWAWCCPKCKEFQPWYWTKEIREDKDGKKVFGGIVWDKQKFDDGSYDFEATGRTARIVCSHCEHVISDTVENRIALNRGGKFLLTKSDGDPKVKTYQCPFQLNPYLTLKDKVIQYLKAYLKNKYEGNDEDLKTFHQQSLAEEWNPKKLWIKPKIFIQRYDPDGEWKDENGKPIEAYRWMAVDYQRTQGARYYVIRAFDRVGNSRQIKYGKAFSWDDIDAIRRAHKVLPQFTLVDAGYEQGEVAAECVRRGEWVNFEQGGKKYKQFCHWLALKGDQKVQWEHADKIVRYYDEGQLVYNSSDLPPATMFLWSNYSVKNIFAKLRDGKGRVKWATNVIDNDYINQLYAEVLEEVPDKKTGLLVRRWTKKHDNNHFLDCECEILVGALMAGLPILGVEESSVKSFSA